MSTSESDKTRPRSVRRSNLQGSRLFGIGRATLIVLVIFVAVAPLVWMVIAAFKTNLDIIDPSRMLNFDFTLKNFESLFGRQNITPFIFNSLLIAVVSTGLSLVIGLPGAYAVSRFSLHKVGMIVLAARIIPGVSLLIPWYFLFSQAGMVGGFPALILTHMFVGVPLIVWILTSFFDGLPRELEEQGEVDGLTPIGSFLRIALPLSTPGIATASILAFIFSWNNFVFALVLSGGETRTLPVSIYNFIGYTSVDWGGLMAASIVITAPILVMALAAQKYIVSGITAGATKG